MDKNSSILVLGAGGMVGRAVVKKLHEHGYTNIHEHIKDEWASTDLTIEKSVFNLFARKQPEYVILCAAKVGGIKANSEQPVQFMEINLAIQNNVIKHCYLNKVKRLLFLGSSCIYPKYCDQPIKEEYLMTGELEPTNKAYALAKIAGIELCRAYNQQYGTEFTAVMPCNLFGDHDTYNDTGHVIPMLIQKFRQAKKNNKEAIEIWGTGEPLREFLHADDLGECLVQLISYGNKLPDLINIGSGHEMSIRELAFKIGAIIHPRCKLIHDYDMPNGTPRKLLDCTLLKNILPSWLPKYDIEHGLKAVISKLDKTK